jgi:myo-inositol-1(or 4)-monophosphatase
MNLQQTTKQISNLARAVGQFISEEALKFSQGDIEIKGLNNFVTYVDKESEKRLIEELSIIIPGSAFIAEEGTVQHSRGEYTWIIDPLDGTTNYIHHLPVYSISIALMHKDELVLGIVYEINNKECFYAWKGGGAFRNGERIKVSERSSVKQSLMATGFPYYDYSQLDSYIRLLRESMKKARGIRRLGSAAVDLAYVACGRFDGFFEYGLHPWDVAAGSLIVKEAGGLVSNFSGVNDYLFKKEIIACNNLIHEEFTAMVKNCFA